MMRNEIHNFVQEIAPELIRIRRHLHQHPELGYEEHQTSAFIRENLVRSGLSPRLDIEGTGVVAEIEGERDKIVGLRVDIDALPIEELTGAPYASKNAGIMHACGHDVHTTLGLGVAYVLTRLREKLPWTVRLLFQPAEELQPGGSFELIRQGAIKNMEAIFGVHVDPGLDAGGIGLKYGSHLASVDTFEVEIQGKGGHAAHPHLAIDSVYIAAQAVTALHGITSRNIDPIKPVVITVTSIHGGGATNIIPETVKLAGTIRTLDKDIRKEIPRLIERTLTGVTQAFGGNFSLQIIPGSSVLVNDRFCTKIIEQTARETLGDEHVRILQVPRMGAEDFANYLDSVPGVMMRLGTRSGARTSHSLHSPCFDIDEDAIAIGVEVLANALLAYMRQSEIIKKS